MRGDDEGDAKGGPAASGSCGAGLGGKVSKGKEERREESVLCI